ncbi:unnamed protein product [Miscanthus lutarioriparius]|uniref:protein-serine/threonine phosphatase n=1 Tax=Miscanthus lutarioriparius TaxID=422564 RepID=A0A811RRJ4_9POAL|nr:unnamed protein product [Miscanthus lutarioriparius]
MVLPFLVPLPIADSAFPSDPSSAFPATDDEGEDEDPEELEVEAIEQNDTKRRTVEEQRQDQGTSVRPEKIPTGASKNVQVGACPHLGYINGLCYTCGNPQDEEDVSGVALDYIHKGLKLGTSEIDRLRCADLKNLLRERKLVLILDLDHTRINSTKLQNISSAEKDLGIQTAASKDDPNRSIFALESMQLLTKLRPFVREFLKEASNMFEILHQKGLDVILGAESVAVILDDTEFVWKKHKENLILMERDHFFASSCREFGFGVRSLSESMQDERESDGALATVLDVLKRIHTIFFDMAVETDLSSRDVRQVIKAVRKEILQDVDSSVTHVVTVDLGTEKARWGVGNKKFLVHPRWIEAANFRWHRQPEEDFPVTAPKEKSGEKGNAVAGKKETSKDKENAAAGQKETRKDKEENDVSSQKETRNDERNVAGQEKDDAKENVVATSTTGPADS